MQENAEMLKLKVLLCLYHSDAEDGTVTGIARTLNREKYAISRTITALEKERFVARSDGRKPVLTQAGRDVAAHYDERVRVCLDHLLYEGVDLENARQDALYLARYCSDETLGKVGDMGARLRVKYELRGRRQFGGAAVCRLLRDGSYHLPYVIYREHVSGGTNISVANEGFDHPCELHVKDGVGTIHLHAVGMNRRTPGDGKLVTAKIQSMKYFDNGRFVSAETYGDIFSIPADTLNFLNYGGVGQLLHGSVCLQIECPMAFGGLSQVIFTLFL